MAAVIEKGVIVPNRPTKSVGQANIEIAAIADLARHEQLSEQFAAGRAADSEIHRAVAGDVQVDADGQGSSIVQSQRPSVVDGVQIACERADLRARSAQRDISVIFREISRGCIGHGDA